MTLHRLLLPLLVALPLRAQQTSPATTVEDLAARVGVIAADSMEGRRTGSDGLERAIRYVEGELDRLGLRPAGRIGYRYPVELDGWTASAAATVAGESGVSQPVEGIVLMSGSAGLPSNPRRQGGGELRFGGFADASDDSTELISAAELDGAALIIWMNRGAVGSPRYNVASLAGPYSPLSALILVSEDSLELHHLRDRVGREMYAPRSALGQQPEGPAVFSMDAASARRLWGEPSRISRDRSLGSFGYQASVNRREVQARNLAALFPGRDSTRAGEFVLLSAHLDHTGIGAPVAEDSIHNGADDDASGAAVLLEVAERLSTGAASPGRSVLLVWHTAEEEGLLGSRAFAERPTVPREDIVAVLNLDMVARNHPDTLFVIGAGRLSGALDAAVRAANARLARPFALDYSLDARDHPEHLYCRSDHLSYARFGIPVAYLTAGLHADYHQPSDEAATLDYGKLARVAELVEALTLELAGTPGRPRVDQPLPPLGAGCS